MSLIENLENAFLTPEIFYTGLVFALFVLPRFLIRFGLPLALSAFLMGVLSSFLNLGFGGDDTIRFLSILGIVSLFLFAGLEVDLAALHRSRKILTQHLVVRLALIVSATFLLGRLLGIGLREAALVSLALLTPSTGFILDTLDHSAVPEASKYWIRSKAIAAEIVALVAMFVLVRSVSWSELLYSSGALLALILLLPIAFRIFAKTVVPVAPKSEFGFLLMVAIFAAMVTKKLGAYYLIGAFVVGLVARRFQPVMPGIASKSMIKSLRFFTGFFTPFYFFYAGTLLTREDVSLSALLLGVILLVTVVPFRIFSVTLHRRLLMGESSVDSLPVATSLLPNLVFGLVLADLLKESFQISHTIFGGIIIYTIGVTVLPPVLLKMFWRSSEYVSVVDALSDFSMEDEEEKAVHRR